MVNPRAPDADFDITQALVRQLVNEQFPAYASLALERSAEGWDNVTFKLGTDYAVRLPRRRESIQLLVNEREWLAQMTPSEGIAIPVPTEHGDPIPEYPCPWHILPWIEGQSVATSRLNDGEALRLARCLRSIHRLADPQAPLNTARGVPLQERADAVAERLARLRRQPNWYEGHIHDGWLAALAAPGASEARWLHGDLHPLNLLQSGGSIVALIDWGDITSGDVATDLASFWMLFDEADVRREALSEYGANGELIHRSRGWAILFGAVLAETGLYGDSQHAQIGAATLRRVAEEKP